MTIRSVLVLVAAALAVPVHAEPVNGMSAARYEAAATPKATQAARMRAESTLARRVELAKPGLGEIAKLATLNRNGGSAFAAPGYPQFIGFGRDVDAEKRRVDLSALAWTTLDGGARVARVEIASAGAKSLRVALRLPATHPDVSVRFATPAASEAAYAVPANVVAQATAQFGEYWSPVVDGDRIAVEFEAEKGATVACVVLEVPMVSHIVVSMTASRAEEAKLLSDIGDSGSCNIDVVCSPPVPQDSITFDAADATGKLVFSVPGGGTARCSGTLLNDTTTSFTPYVFSANHCFQGAYEAATLQVWWFFDATACHSNTPGNYVVQNGGAFLLGRSQDWDWALMRLNSAPPGGVVFAGWTAAAIPAGVDIEVYHHPSGDLKKWSAGTTFDPQHVFFGTAGGGPGFFTRVVYGAGTTEGGSSGAALRIFDGVELRVVGGLLGGDALCSNLTGSDFYSQFSAMFPLVRQYLTPNVIPPGFVLVVEFYNPTLNHYFMTASPFEIGILDGGNPPGWQRTGFTFLAYDGPGAGHSPVCRYYQQVNNSHFYSADPAQCALVPILFPDWTFEASNVFYMGLPNTTTGACPAGTRPVYRFFHSAFVNHRFPAEQTVATVLNSTPGWAREGYGPGPLFPAMCSPLGS
jgi:lysyl endopeptidase